MARWKRKSLAGYFPEEFLLVGPPCWGRGGGRRGWQGTVGDWRSSGATHPSLRPIGRGEGNLVLLAARAKQGVGRERWLQATTPLPRAAAAPSKRSLRFPPRSHRDNCISWTESHKNSRRAVAPLTRPTTLPSFRLFPPRNALRSTGDVYRRKGARVILDRLPSSSSRPSRPSRLRHRLLSRPFVVFFVSLASPRCPVRIIRASSGQSYPPIFPTPPRASRSGHAPFLANYFDISIFKDVPCLCVIYLHHPPLLLPHPLHPSSNPRLIASTG